MDNINTLSIRSGEAQLRILPSVHKNGSLISAQARHYIGKGVYGCTGDARTCTLCQLANKFLPDNRQRFFQLSAKKSYVANVQVVQSDIVEPGIYTWRFGQMLFQLLNQGFVCSDNLYTPVNIRVKKTHGFPDFSDSWIGDVEQCNPLTIQESRMMIDLDELQGPKVTSDVDIMKAILDLADLK